MAFPDSIPRYWFNGSPLLTHLLNVYTLLIPDNESYYIRQLKRCLKEIGDPHLKTQLLRFFRQEGQHGIEHKAFWTNLEQQGIPHEGFTRAVNWFFYRVLEPILPRPVHLANIACIEHINAYHSYPVRLLSAVLVFPMFYLFSDGALVHDLRNIGRYLMPGFHPRQIHDYSLARDFLHRAASRGYVQPVTVLD